MKVPMIATSKYKKYKPGHEFMANKSDARALKAVGLANYATTDADTSVEILTREMTPAAPIITQPADPAIETGADQEIVDVSSDVSTSTAVVADSALEIVDDIEKPKTADKPAKKTKASKKSDKSE